MNTTEHNEIFELAANLVNYTHKHVFLTGKAGTGKTTFLKYIRENTHKNLAVVAPTGVAAINAGGTTLHSLLQLPFGVYVPEGSRPWDVETREEVHDKHSLLRRLRFSGSKRKVIEALELLIIDEISMVRADLLDMVDAVLRHVRRRPQLPFGGVQLLYIGDMFQLPPVTKDEDSLLLKRYYKSNFFFDAKVIASAPPLYVELTKVYRQRDEHFVEVLNQVRNNDLTDDGLHILQQRYHPAFKPKRDENYITLTTHNYQADAINSQELADQKNPLHKFEAKVQHDFPEHAYPAEKTLQLKVGAQVMFIKNDTESPRRFFNGKIGVVKRIDADGIHVDCPGDDEFITVAQETWKNIRYTYEADTKSVKEDELGSFTQYPLRLAWAITIHKSQGLTFERAIINPGKAFAAGQVYVALSRCTCLEGMVLLSPVHRGLVFTEERIAQFGRKKRSVTELHVQAATAKRNYLEHTLTAVFKWEGLVNMAVEIQQLFSSFEDLFNTGAANWLSQLVAGLQEMQKQAAATAAQLPALLQRAKDLETDPALDALLRKSAADLSGLLQKKIWPLWAKRPNVQAGKKRKAADEFFQALDEIKNLLEIRTGQLKKLEKGFSVDRFFAKTRIDVPASVNRKDLPFDHDNPRQYVKTGQLNGDNTAAEMHPELYKQLRQLTDAIVHREQLPSYRIASAATLTEMATYLPQTENELLAIHGFGHQKVKWIGDEFLEVIQDYCDEYGLKSMMAGRMALQEPQKPKGPKIIKGETLQVTLSLLQEGKTIAEIAAERELAQGTIEGHIASAITAGQVKLADVLPAEKLNLILPLIPDTMEEGFSIIPIKERLGDAASFGEIRMVVAWKRRMVQEAAAGG